MDRRSFIKNSGLGVIGTYYAPLFLKNSEGLFNSGNERKLIVVQLSGGNDGLNTIVPYENDLYYNARPRLGIDKKDIIKLNDDLGFNPALSSLEEIFKAGSMSIVNSVGYPNPNRSHFRSMDIWHTATDSNSYSQTGWIGRYMDSYCQNPHDAIEVDTQLSLSLNGMVRNGLAVENSKKLYRALRGPYFQDLLNLSKKEDLDDDNLGYLYRTLIQTDESAEYLFRKHKITKNNVEFPKSKLGKKMSMVSQFIRSGLSTKVFYVSQNGYDSHVNQRGSQDRLLKDYANSMQALVDSLEKSGHFENTLILTFSEFGRRVKENASSGTDHGKANNLFIMGKNLKKPGIYNSAPDLQNLDDGDVSYEIDFRNIYHDIINEWFQKSPESVISTSFDSLGIIS